MNEPTTSNTFDSNRKAYAFARRFLVSATGAAALVVLASVTAYGQSPIGLARTAAVRPSHEEGVSTEVAAATVPAAAARGLASQPTRSGTIAHAPQAKVLRPATPRAPGSRQPAVESKKVDPKEVVAVMVELTDVPAATVYANSMNSSVARFGGKASLMSTTAMAEAKATAAGLSRAHVRTLEQAHQAVLPKLNSMAHGGRVIFRTKSAYNGISLYVHREQIADLRKIAGVKAVHIQTMKYYKASSDIDFLGGRTPWTTSTASYPFGLHGEGIKVGDIDTGLDFVHTNFGGPGTPAAYAAVTDTNPAGFFPSLKVPGGYDFAGDNYNGSNLPTPDANPMDAAGHGSATASLIAGLGVNGDGTTYNGAYDNTTDLNSMRISPGFAPKALLYPLRVFGKTGGTNLVTQAIDWAIDPNGDGNLSDHLDVINMSLGSDIGNPGDDSDAIAINNAVAVGMLVVCSAGNAGDALLQCGSPFDFHRVAERGRHL